ncbi:bifunctional 4-hydroxy-2-oxoglutarate aldolase/2-dehydro-3-deoxy-phosphogluconate aldolase [Tuwongella immobilis]|uniref:Uncharacterized protein n=1 Tax=Tuwongella immobilis TaxID=692036 RepID=A0A6C2YKD1_9BACT|nr:bifunctional 4-hydroxy-2-oxoglutarate aldolase/2-dehydro-3-deoxy-phosphogluconate aldolase [Tuwongella immobilis]VIP01886.1 2-dehydro-3-deoxyphosphogluconate aldolase : Entner-Doudoroff aldolase OS=Singulisphaera acidiphila (strain ATCC BAA-1392 / DSM 18658 / VKM B-2454 / MOB10) GN=Sinac_1080 PE=4 SV=1: Aldolase [Tuwongella immobilis]VTR99746.1 2-dehydro-3-deoxyphosphogluconate aldolase : Entner-Doudoroff aldolase OS=Singulisphaera acidiphila (strain ATCC BAA-1392 / DSM 18658 / VKM B-2454 / MO
MNRTTPLTEILSSGIIAVIRTPNPDDLVDVVGALADGGVTVAELTFTIPNALAAIAAVRKQLGDRVLVGAGTVLDAETARAAILAGADFIVSPVCNRDLISLCRRYSTLVMPGAFTPTEILTAWEAGADIVKVFPAEVLGPAFFKAMRGPLPQVRIMPTGGVDLSTARQFLDAGACCLGVGSQLVNPKAIASRDFAQLTDLARQYRSIVTQFQADSARSKPVAG